jgi:DNA-binding response OmpR family regulator
MRILLVEDDDRLAGALTSALQRHGMQVTRAPRAADALRHTSGIDFVLLDLGLPDMDGVTLLRQLRAVSAVPVIVVTARCEERDLIQGLRAGADDYLVKPFRLPELLARMEAVLRRAEQRPPGDADRPRDARVRVGDVEIDLDARVVTVTGDAVPLTRREFDVLALLARRPGVARSREEILDRVWGDASLAESRSLDVHVAGIRSKTRRPELIVTLRGLGYRLADPDR